MIVLYSYSLLICLIFVVDSYQIYNYNTKIKKDIINHTSKLIIIKNIFNVIKVSANTMNDDDDNNNDIVVIGSNGKTGKLIVKKLKERKIPVREASRQDNNENENENKIKIDVTKIGTIENAIKNSKAVIFAASASNYGGNANDVDYIGLQNVANEVIRLKIPKLIIISVAALNRPNSTVYATTNFIGNIRSWKKNIMENKLLGEEAVINAYNNNNDKDKNLSYIIIRPGILFDAKGVGSNNIELNQGDTISGEINREDLADCIIAATLSKTITNNVIFEIYQTEGTRGPLEDKFSSISGYEQNGSKFNGDYDQMFQGLKSNLFII